MTLNSLDTDISFWELYPEFKVINPFKDIYLNDKSKSKTTSSKLMWFVALCYSKSSKFSRLQIDGIDGKHYVVGLDYCNNPNYYEDNKEILDSVIDMFLQITYTPLERHLKTWEDLLDKRTSFLKTQQYDLGNYEDLDKMAIGTDKVYSTIKKIQEELNKEDINGIGKGGSVSSLND